MTHAFGGELRERILANLRTFERRPIDDDSPRAAVAITVCDLDGEAGYVFIRRSLTMRSNAGQYALPGGRCEPGEGAADAARRELAEEVGVAVGTDGVLGLLDDLVTRTGRVVTPVVCWVDGPVALVLDPGEVHDAWVVPVSELDHAEAPRWVTVREVEGRVLRMPVRGEWINPPTAAMLYQFREVALHGRAVRVHDVSSPRWTGR